MQLKFDVIKEKDDLIFLTNAQGNDLIRSPLLNKGTAFSKEEREQFFLEGLLPPKSLTLDEQVKKIYVRYKRLEETFQICKSCKKYDSKKYKEIKKTVDVQKYNFLRDLQDRNEILFYAVLHKYMQEMIPIVYTPTVGDAVIRYSKDSAKFRGLFFDPKNISKNSNVFDNFRFKKPTIAVITDNQGILGLGDQGVGGIDISIGKLALYVLGAGIRPWETVPITLDVGTHNKQGLGDPFYLGIKSDRLSGKNYYDFMDKFVEGVQEKFPGMLVQWEDFSKQNAFTILDRYKDKVLSFNDDIQGTGAVALAGILNGLRYSNERLKDQKFVIYGAGAGGIGIARQIKSALTTKEKLNKQEASSRIAVLDSRGLVTEEKDVEEYKKSFLTKKSVYEKWNVKNKSNISLLEVVKNFKPTVLIGTSGMPGHFTDEIIFEMAKNTNNPIIFPMSNPTSKSETTPDKIIKLTKAKALIATGSPFDTVDYKGTKYEIGQGNNFLIFPGVGFGAIVSGGRYISDEVFTESAYKLSEITAESRIRKKTVFPEITKIRDISAQIALATTNQISKEQDTKSFTLNEIKSMMWKPQYHKLKKSE